MCTTTCCAPLSPGRPECLEPNCRARRTLAGTRRIDLAAVDDAQFPQTIEAVACETQAALNIEDGPVARFVYLDLGPRRLSRLLIVIHHLVVDAVSWPGILLADLDSLCRQQIRDWPPRTAQVDVVCAVGAACW